MIMVDRSVRAEPERVWDFVARVADWAALLPTVDHVEQVSGTEPPSLGARYAIRQPGLARLVYEITRWDPPRSFTWVAGAPGVRTTATHEVATAPGGSVLRLTLGWTGALAPLVRLLFSRRTRAYVELEAATFARLAEEQGA